MHCACACMHGSLGVQTANPGQLCTFGIFKNKNLRFSLLVIPDIPADAQRPDGRHLVPPTQSAPKGRPAHLAASRHSSAPYPCPKSAGLTTTRLRLTPVMAPARAFRVAAAGCSEGGTNGRDTSVCIDAATTNILLLSPPPPPSPPPTPLAPARAAGRDGLWRR